MRRESRGYENSLGRAADDGRSFLSMLCTGIAPWPGCPGDAISVLFCFRRRQVVSPVLDG